MADWTELDTNGLLPGEPLTSAKALAFFENPTAMAEGAVNAPKVVSGALDMLAELGTETTAYTNLDRVNKILIDARLFWESGSGSSFGRYRTSTNNGSTYSGYTTLTAISESSRPLIFKRVILSLGPSINAIQFNRSSSGPWIGSFEYTVLGVSGVSP